VHSAKCSQITGGRLSLVSASTILGTIAWLSPRVAAIPPQYLKNVLLVIGAFVIGFPFANSKFPECVQIAIKFY
jgi:hypothetical protein